VSRANGIPFAHVGPENSGRPARTDRPPEQAGDPGARATLTEAAALGRGSGATAIAGSAAAGIAGRDLELDPARNAVHDLCRGQGSTLLMGGEGGIGNTPMVQSVIDDARAHGVIVCYGEAHPFERARSKRRGGAGPEPAVA